MSKVTRALIVGMAFACLLAPSAVSAHEGEDDTARDQSSAQEERSKRADQLKNRLEDFKQQRQAVQTKRLEANKLRACEQRKANIAAIMQRSIGRAENQIKLFDSIAERVKAFYVKKGKVLDNYAELVASVDAAKATAQADLETLQGLEAFDCSSEDPKGNAELFKLAHQTVLHDLKDYRTAVKDLIVGVKSVQGSTSRSSRGDAQ